MDEKNPPGTPDSSDGGIFEGGDRDGRMDESAAAAGQQDAVAALRSLSVSSPEHTFQRFRRRASIVQGTRMLFESQVTGFWIVLDAFLRLAFCGSPLQPEATASQRDKA